MGPAVIVHAYNYTGTVFTSQGMKKLFKKMLEARRVTLESLFFLIRSRLLIISLVPS